MSAKTLREKKDENRRKAWLQANGVRQTEANRLNSARHTYVQAKSDYDRAVELAEYLYKRYMSER